MSNIKNSQSNLSQYGNLLFSIGSAGYDLIMTWLVKSLIPTKSFGVIYGPSGSLKSFFAIELCCHIATGKKWGARNIQQGAVIYVAAEGISGVAKRVKAWEIARNEQVKDLCIHGNSIIISETSSQDNLIQAIKDYKEDTGVDVKIVVLDTLARCNSGDENTTKDMSRFISGCDRVKAATGVSILCIHHTGKDENKGGRGSSSLMAACDFEFKIKRMPKSNKITLINTKQKDSEETPDLGIEFELIDLGIVCDDKLPITSLARIKNIIEMAPPSKPQIHDILRLLIDQFEGEATRSELRNSLYSNSSKNKLTDVQRQYLSRELKKLESNGQIKIEQSTSSKPSDSDKIIILK